jgi:hypothetical protein
MLVSLDKLASRYSVLPGDLLERASTFDLYVMDIGIRYEALQEQKRKGLLPDKPVKQLSPEEMKAMLERTRNVKSQNS